MESITLQIHSNGRWRDALVVSFDLPRDSLRSRCNINYLPEYLVDQFIQLGTVKAPAVSANFPLEWDIRREPAPAFLRDIIPAGAGRRHILARTVVPSDISFDLFLLQQFAAAPIGHMRIKRAAGALCSAQKSTGGFHRDEVVQAGMGFLDQAKKSGMAISGALGAGGEAPKMLLVEDAWGQLYPEGSLRDADVCRHWFVKFPRNSATQLDRDILHSEYCFYRALDELGVDTITAEGLAYEAAKIPSIWMQRFDRKVSAEGVERIAVESMYSLCGARDRGGFLNHFDVVDRLAETWIAAGQESEIPDMISEYLRRDLINQVAGNTDNHGGNLSILRGKERVSFAPVYDLAPMLLDVEGIVRITRWSAQIERLGSVDWRAVCARFAHRAEPEWLFDRLQADARLLLALPDLLQDLGLRQEVWRSPMIPLRCLEDTFRRWKLM
ncbi:toxin HipA [Pseudomonas sp. FW215-R2]|jgi:serine/threonine-protein kinase HipA|uniref:HipA domain-containing protein n=1 Tax=unclassified Pseudomonas TaxID=196821 RepID=UPI000C887E90|nr:MULTISPECIES: HipA domain-containing protein [unclassified Pseudomonas]PMX02308.1 toxin HipA [Pseudomonas sp. FW215-R2]PMX10994.1 toxin HipA [Pseudomonas sp. FW215-L1]PMX20820.1 toxin HipA [Pseudomonas sp. FW215-E1]PNA25487.1 toxin HipA [Pseudomonas sp. FW215-R4]